MVNTAIKLKWDEFHRNVLNRWNQRHNDQLRKMNSMNERSISILQKRYGYTREEAVSELSKHYPKAWLG